VNLYQIMASPEHFYTVYAPAEKLALPGVIARTYQNLPSLEMTSMVSQIVTSADLKQLESEQSSESGTNMGNLGAVNHQHDLLWFDVCFVIMVRHRTSKWA
jgi:hypothetical protein